MAKYSQTIQHDYLRFKARFDTIELSGGYSRGGDRLEITPYDPVIAREVSIVFTAIGTARKAGKFNLGQQFEVMEPIGKSAKDLQSFLIALRDALSAKFGVDLSGPVALPQKDATSVVLTKKGRSPNLQIDFANGEEMSLSLAGKSVRYLLKPDMPIFSGKIAGMALGMAAMYDSEELVDRFKEAAEVSPDVETWISKIAEGYRHGNAPAADGAAKP